MLEKVKQIIEDERLLWQAERQPTKKDKIFGCFLLVVLFLFTCFLIFYLKPFAEYIERFPAWVQFLSAGFIMLFPILTFGSAIIHILGDEKIN